MPASGFLTLAIAILAEAGATSMLKASDGFTRLVPSAAAILGYGIAIYCLSLTLRFIPVGIAYAIWSGVGMVLIAAVAWIVSGERLDPAAMLGIGLILAGVLVLNLMSGSLRH